VATLDLTRQGGVEKVRVDIFGVSSFTAVNLIHDKWLSNEITMKIAPGTGGSVHWKLSDGAAVLTDSDKTDLATWPANASRLRPNWGIYRSLGDQADVNTTYILLSDMRGYLCQ
jgi:hypothetical protein